MDLDIKELNAGLLKAENISTIKLFLANGADINAKDRNKLTLLFNAACEHREEICEFLLKQPGIDVNITDDYQESALMKTYNLKIIKMLVEAGINIEARSKCGRTPLLHQASHERYENVRYLIKIGADTTVKDNNNKGLEYYIKDKNKIKSQINVVKDEFQKLDDEEKDKFIEDIIKTYSKEKRISMIETLFF